MAETRLSVKLLCNTPNPDSAAAAAARQCYSAKSASELMDSLSSDEVAKLVRQVVKSGHHSVLEHASFTFAVEGVSRACTHQLVRHRIASYSQQSQRYVRAKDFDYVVPESIKKNGKAAEFAGFMHAAADLYSRLCDAGIDKEDARFVLPNACETKIVITMNCRELLHFFEKRTCSRAQWEIRALAEEMMRLCKEKAPLVFETAGPSCVSKGVCYEGKMSCGRWKNIPGCVLKGD
ncbi:thymidylate synthase (FAD) [Candidatus Micrarchaeota archaeon CG10_big_fil_rev_8_21_14_0_10_59_7]|nr:MAG: thymidylate synthase (FAD) [Candidatus Micrarchaeota archaeon CG10_big_fil_rev_8_21_14_0_10_59_7]